MYSMCVCMYVCMYVYVGTLTYLHVGVQEGGGLVFDTGLHENPFQVLAPVVH